jgi:PAS domain-containing protein
MREMTGVRAEEMVGKRDHAYAIPFYGTKRPLLIDLALREDETIEAGYAVFKRFCDRVIAEVYIPTLKKGTYLSGTAGVLRNTNGEIVGAIESIRDITERKRLEETLRESEERYGEIFDHSIEGGFRALRRAAFGASILHLQEWPDMTAPIR